MASGTILPSAQGAAIHPAFCSLVAATLAATEILPSDPGEEIAVTVCSSPAGVTGTVNLDRPLDLVWVHCETTDTGVFQRLFTAIAARFGVLEYADLLAGDRGLSRTRRLRALALLAPVDPDDQLLAMIAAALRDPSADVRAEAGISATLTKWPALAAMLHAAAAREPDAGVRSLLAGGAVLLDPPSIPPASG